MIDRAIEAKFAAKGAKLEENSCKSAGYERMV